MNNTTTAGLVGEDARSLVEYRERVGLMSSDQLLRQLEQLAVYSAVVEVGSAQWALLDLKIEAVRAEVLDRMID